MDGGEYFSFFRAGIQEAVAPREVVFSHKWSTFAHSLLMRDAQGETDERARTPDIVMFSVFGSRHKAQSDAARIMFVGEAWDIKKEPDAITMVHCVKNVPETQYFPFWVSSFGERRCHRPEDLIKSEDADWGSILESKKNFCAFLYSHESEARDSLFDLISGYKRVQAIGKWKHNDDGFPFDRDVNNGTLTYNDLAVDKYKSFKFAIAGENNLTSPGYVTEKIVNVMLANTIPIYIGSPDIAGTQIENISIGDVVGRVGSRTNTFAFDALTDQISFRIGAFFLDKKKMSWSMI